MGNSDQRNEVKAIMFEDLPSFKRGEKVEINIDEKVKAIIIRNIYSRKLEDLTFNDLNMIGYANPNIFVNERIREYGSFDGGKVVWVVVYVADKNG